MIMCTIQGTFHTLSICPSCQPFNVGRTNSIISILQVRMSGQCGVQAWAGTEFWVKTSALFYLLHYLSKSKQLEAMERDPPLFANDLVLKQPSHHIQKHRNKSLANPGQKPIVSLGDSDLVI